MNKLFDGTTWGLTGIVFGISLMVFLLGVLIYNETGGEISTERYEKVSGWIKKQPQLSTQYKNYMVDGKISKNEFGNLHTIFHSTITDSIKASLSEK